MRDYGRADNGAQVIMVSCCDERFPPEHMLDGALLERANHPPHLCSPLLHGLRAAGKDSSFWITTGLFPQEFVLKLKGVVQVSKITTLSLNGEASLCIAGHWRYASPLPHPSCLPSSMPAVKKLSVEKCEQDRPDAFDRVFEVGERHVAMLLLLPAILVDVGTHVGLQHTLPPVFGHV